MSKKQTLTDLKQQERENRKRFIIDAAQRVFSSRPYDKVSMREIADEAGMATSSLYTYFSNQESLFIESAIINIHHYRQYIQDISEKDIPVEEKIRQSVDYFIDYVARNESFFRMMALFMTYGQLNDESLALLNDAIREIFDVMEGVLGDASLKGDPRRCAHFFLAALNGILVTYRKLPGRDEEEIILHMKGLGELMTEMILSMREEPWARNRSR
jgi:AcrR family transcriptional regulator